MHKFMEQVTPHNLPKLKLYDEETPLFSRFQIENQIESAFSRDVQLSSGGSIVFDRTEALISIDVNSARATKGADIEETALNTNLEAAEEIALQLRLRDLGGLIVIDFIDMTPARNQRAVEQRLNDALKFDRARVQVGRISRFGLLEMSRQRLRPSLGEASSLVCPRCSGTGHIRGVQSSALQLLRLIQEEAMKENTAALHVHLPIATATFLLNEKRHELNTMESRLATPIYIIPAADMETPHYRIRRLRSEDVEAQEEQPSYKIERVEDEETTSEAVPGITQITAAEKPAVGQLVPMGAAPPRKVKAKAGIFVRLFRALFGTGEKKKKPKTPARGRGGPRPQRGRRGGQRTRGQGSPARGRAGQQTRTQKPQQPKPKSAEAGDSGESKQDKPERKEGQQRGGRGRRGRGGRRQSQRARGGKPQEGTGTQGDDGATKGPAPQAKGNSDDDRGNRVEAKGGGNRNPEPRRESAPQSTENQQKPAAPAETAPPAPKPAEPVAKSSSLVQIETKSTDSQS